MANAKEEFLHMVKNETVLCAEISYQDCWEHDSPGSKHTLPVTYTEDRGEYDGSEWWQHHICPVVPKSLLF